MPVYEVEVEDPRDDETAEDLVDRLEAMFEDDFVVLDALEELRFVLDEDDEEAAEDEFEFE